MDPGMIVEAFSSVLVAGIFFAFLAWIYRDKEQVVKDCDHGYHEWGMWTGDFIYQNRHCSRCGLMVTRKIENEGVED